MSFIVGDVLERFFKLHPLPDSWPNSIRTDQGTGYITLRFSSNPVNQRRWQLCLLGRATARPQACFGPHLLGRSLRPLVVPKGSPPPNAFPQRFHLRFALRLVDVAPQIQRVRHRTNGQRGQSLPWCRRTRLQAILGSGHQTGPQRIALDATMNLEQV
jgi:hypothetical protein